MAQTDRQCVAFWPEQWELQGIPCCTWTKRMLLEHFTIGGTMQDSVTPRARITVDIDAALVSAVGASGADISAVIDQALETYLRSRKSQPLNDDERASHDEYNRFIAEHGTLADSLQDI